MPANPTIKFVSATKDAASTLIMALLENTSRGMVQMRAYLSPTCVTEDAAMRAEGCVRQTSNIYIPEMYWLANCLKTATTTASSACLRDQKEIINNITNKYYQETIQCAS